MMIKKPEGMWKKKYDSTINEVSPEISDYDNDTLFYKYLESYDNFFESPMNELLFNIHQEELSKRLLNIGFLTKPLQ